MDCKNSVYSAWEIEARGYALDCVVCKFSLLPSHIIKSNAL